MVNKYVFFSILISDFMTCFRNVKRVTNFFMFSGRPFHCLMYLYDVVLRYFVSVYFTLRAVCDFMLRQSVLLTFWLCFIMLVRNSFDIPFVTLKMWIVTVKVSISFIWVWIIFWRVSFYVHSNNEIQIMIELIFSFTIKGCNRYSLECPFTGRLIEYMVKNKTVFIDFKLSIFFIFLECIICI